MIYNTSYTNRVRQAVSGRSVPSAPTSKPSRPKAARRPGAAPQPLDAADLSRRLLLVQAEQKTAQAERKRKDKAARSSQPTDTAGEGERGPLKEVNGQQQQPPPAPTKVPSRKKEKLPAERKSGESSKSAREQLSRTSTGENEPPSSAAAQPYVPREAAAQFARTATPLGMLEGPLAHRLSRQALKATFEKTLATGNPPQLPQLTSKDTLRRSASQRDSRVLDRSHTRPPRIVEEEVEDVGDVSMPPEAAAKAKLRFALKDEMKNGTGVSNGEPGWKMGHKKRPSSTGDLADRMERHELHKQILNRRSLLVVDPDEERLPEEPQEDDEEIIDPEHADEHRVDWTQSDEKKRKSAEVKPGDGLSPAAAAGMASKRRKSIWGLRMKFGQHARQDDPVAVADEEKTQEIPVEPLSPKSPKARFFSRFKH